MDVQGFEPWTFHRRAMRSENHTPTANLLGKNFLFLNMDFTYDHAPVNSKNSHIGLSILTKTIIIE